MGGSRNHILPILFAVLICGWGALMSGCSLVQPSAASSAYHYSPPASCVGTYDNATGAYTGGDSEILHILPDPTGVGVAFQLANYAVVKNGVYKTSDVLSVLNSVEGALNASTDYGTLAAYVNGKVEGANAAAGTLLFTSTGLLYQFTSRKPITECDKAILLRHIASQRSIINTLSYGK